MGTTAGENDKHARARLRKPTTFAFHLRQLTELNAGGHSKLRVADTSRLL